MMKLVIISDNHSNYDFEVPDGDVLIHCGDFSFKGDLPEVLDFILWFESQPHKNKIFIYGNHELGPERDYYNITDMIEEGTGAECVHNIRAPIDIDGITFWGSSFTPSFRNWAFMKDEEQRKRYWCKAPSNVDVLVTHGPPYGLLDTVDGLEIEPGKLENLGCKYQREYIERVKPKLVAFGHIHDSAGQMTLKHWDSPHDTICVNAALMDEKYKLTNEPIVVEITENDG